MLRAEEQLRSAAALPASADRGTVQDWESCDLESPRRRQSRSRKTRRNPTAVRWRQFPSFWNEFERVGEIGSGSFGSVSHIRRRRPGEGSDRDLALKLLHSRQNPRQPLQGRELEAVDRELRALRHLSQSGLCDAIPCYRGHMLVPTYQHAIVMNMVAGEDLFDWVKQWHSDNELPPPPSVMRKLMCSALKGLAQVHARDVVHRDIKPENMMIVSDRNGRPQRLVFIDFGLGCVVGDCGADRDFVGTPIYASPDVVRWWRDRGRADANDENTMRTFKAADVYSLGQVFLTMIQGVPPPAQIWADYVRDGRLSTAQFFHRLAVDERPFQPLAYPDKNIRETVAQMMSYDYDEGKSIEEATGHRFTAEQAWRHLTCEETDPPTSGVKRVR